MTPTPNQTVKSTETSVMIIETLAGGNGQGVTEVAECVGLHKSTIHKHLKTLIKLGYVEKDGTRYRLSVGFSHLGEGIKRRESIYTVWKSRLDSLSESTNETVGLYVLSGHRGYDIYRSLEMGKRPMESMSTHLHCHAPGKAILSQLDSSLITEILDERGTPEYTEYTRTSRDDLFEDIEWTAETQVAFSREEQFDGINSLAVPVRSVEDDGRLGAVYIVGTAARLSGKRFEEELPGMLLNLTNQTPLVEE